jgi:hypothetical protein
VRLRDRLFPRRDLERVVEPTPVILDGVIETEDETISPMSGVRAAVVRWTFFESLAMGGLRNRSVVRPVASGMLGPPGRGLLVKVAPHILEIPIHGLDLRVPGNPNEGHPVGAQLPEMFAEALAAAGAIRGALLYRETYLQHGDAVRVQAVVSVPCRGEGSPYRAASRIDFVAHGRVVIESG